MPKPTDSRIRALEEAFERLLQPVDPQGKGLACMLEALASFSNQPRERPKRDLGLGMLLDDDTD